MSSADPGGAYPPNNLMKFAPQWLRKALGLTEPTLPSRLNTEAVLSVLDVFQQGAGVAVWNNVQPLLVSVTGVLAAGKEVVLNFDDDNIRIIFELSFERIAGAGAVNQFLQLESHTAANPFVFIANISFGVTATGIAAPSREGNVASPASGGVLPGRPLIVPPGMRLTWSHDALAAAETINVSGTVLTAPLGFKLW